MSKFIPIPDAKTLRAISVLGNLSDAELQEILHSPANGIVAYDTAQNIIQEGEAADCMYIILDGTVDVRVDAVAGRQITIATLRRGEFFGEQALLPGATGKRNATVRALEPCQLFRICKTTACLTDQFRASTGNLDVDVPHFPDSEDRVLQLLRSNRLFRALPDQDLASLVQTVATVDIPPGEFIIREAEAGDCMYVILDGAVEVFIIDDDGRMTVLATLGRGHYFGEQALLPRSTGRRNANVRSNTVVSLIRITKEQFLRVLHRDQKLLLALNTIGTMQQAKISLALCHHN
jgi:CRP-like cAMP-binding protein